MAWVRRLRWAVLGKRGERRRRMRKEKYRKFMFVFREVKEREKGGPYKKNIAVFMFVRFFFGRTWDYWGMINFNFWKYLFHKYKKKIQNFFNGKMDLK